MILDLIVHNIRSAENVGSILRTADALGVHRIWISGYSAGADHPKVKKTALGAQSSVDCLEMVDIREVFGLLREEAYLIVGLEIDPRAIVLSDFHPKADRIALLLGNEVEGIAPHLRDRCDELIFIPQHGIKESLNVAVATGIAVFQILNAKFKIQH